MTTLRVAALALWAASGMSAAELTAEQWRADVAFLARELPQRHKNLFHTLPRAEFEQRVEALSAAIPRLPAIEVRAGITRLVAAVGDGHTHAGLESDRYFDLAFLEFPEGLFIISGVQGYEAAIGARVVTIDGTAVAEVRKRLVEFVSIENQFSAQEYAGWVRNAAAMKAAGIIRSMDEAEFLLEKDGHSFPLTVRTRLAKDPRPARVKETREQPLYLQRADAFYWWKYLAEAKTLYIQYSSCREMPALPFQKFTDQIVEQVAREAPDKVVIDLRQNGGGNSEVSNPLLEAMRAKAALRPRGGVYVLTGVGTFSSGLMVAIRFAERFQAMIAGDPSGEKPNHYGDMRTFRLPNSGIEVSYSTQHFIQMESNPPALMPELPVPLTAADYFAGRDAVLEAVLKLPASGEANYRSAIARDKGNARAYEALSQIYLEQGRAPEAEALLRSSPGQRLGLASYYLRAKKYPQARATAEAVLRTDPDSTQALYDLGEAYMGEASYQQAAEAFHKCYRLEPDNLRGVKMATEAYTRSGKFDAAIAEYQQAIAHGKNDQQTLEFRLLLSEAYRKKGDATAAVRTFEEAYGLVMEFAKTAGVNPATLAGLLRNFFEQQLRGEPNDGVLLHNLGYVLARSGMDFERGLTLARRAREKLPEVKEVGETLAWMEAQRK